MGLVDEHQALVSPGELVEKEVAEDLVALALGFPVLVNIEFPEDHLNQLNRRNPGIEYHGHLNTIVQVPDHVPEERCFTRAHIAGNDDEPVLIGKAVLQVGQGCLVLGAQIQVFGIGEQVEGFFFKAVEI